MDKCVFEKISGCKILTKKNCKECHFRMTREEYEEKINETERYMRQHELKTVIHKNKVVFAPENSNIGRPILWNKI